MNVQEVPHGGADKDVEEASSGPKDKQTSNTGLKRSSNGRRNLFYVASVLLAMAATGAAVWYIPDCRVQASASSSEQDDEAKTQPPTAASAPPSSLPLLVISETKPFSLCMGDCDEDSDCGPGLRCFQRSKNTEVPGCSGGLEDNSNTDYCIPVDDNHHPHPVEQPYLVETNTFPLGVCEGDCDSNDDCRDGLVCYQRSEFEDVPGCTGGTEDESRTDYCVPRSLVPETYLISLGDKLVGNPDDNFGSSVSLSQSDPPLMAVGAVDLGSTGYVNIYQLSEDDNWVLAATIQGNETGSNFGHTVSMSWDGKYVAVGMPSTQMMKGRVRVFELLNLNTADNTQSTYMQVGNDIREGYDSWAGEGGFGYSVSLSNDGRILAVTEDYAFNVYERTDDDTGDWSLLGSDYVSGLAFSKESISLSGDGSRVAVSVRRYGDTHIRVYEYYDDTNWVQVCEMLPEDDSCFGMVSLSGDGSTVVMECIDKASGNSYVRIYQETGDAQWTPVGDPILSQSDKASKVEISKDGEMLAIGDYDLGRVRLYEFESKIGQWVLVGEVHSENEDDLFGVALSLSGGRGKAYLAIGGPNQKHLSGNPGFAVTYKTSFGIRPDPTSAPTSAPTALSDGSSNTSIFSVTSACYGECSGFIQTVGRSVALSGDGKFFAYGLFNETSMSKVAIISSDGAEMDPLPELSGSEIGDEFGYSIAFSHNGQRMAVGIPNSRVGTVEGSGRVKVYEFDQAESAWKQMGDDLVGSGRFGHSVSLNKDGDIIAIGAPWDSDTGVSIFRFENNKEWVKLGDNITVPSWKAAWHGWSVSLSGDGFVVAVGGPTNEDGWDESGACRIYEYVNNEWQQRGEQITGQTRHGLLGTSVSLSDDGNIVAIGAIGYHLPVGDWGKAGAVVVYEYSSEEGDWRSLGKTIFADEISDRFGASVSLVKNENKLYLAAGAPAHGDGGHVRLFVFDDEHSYWDQVDDVQRDDPLKDDGEDGDSKDDDKKGAGFGTTVALAGGSDGLLLAVGAPGARSGYERLGLIPKYVGEAGEVTLWQV